MMKAVERKGEEKINRRSWVDQFYVEIDQVQKRFNCFLIACSILLFAFAFTTSGGLATGTGNGIWIAYPIGIMGAFLSFYFFWINYYQWRIAETVRSRILPNRCLKTNWNPGNGYVKVGIQPGNILYVPLSTPVI
jgi:hypothetical protein